MFYICASVLCVRAQGYTIIPIKYSSSESSINYDASKYDFVQSMSVAFLIDVYSGKVWEYVGGKKSFVEIPIEDCDNTVADIPTYRLYINYNNSSTAFVLNVHTGQMWRYATVDGRLVFKKLPKPM